MKLTAHAFLLGLTEWLGSRSKAGTALPPIARLPRRGFPPNQHRVSTDFVTPSFRDEAN